MQAFRAFQRLRLQFQFVRSLMQVNKPAPKHSYSPRISYYDSPKDPEARLTGIQRAIYAYVLISSGWGYCRIFTFDHTKEPQENFPRRRPLSEVELLYPHKRQYFFPDEFGSLVKESMVRLAAFDESFETLPPPSPVSRLTSSKSAQELHARQEELFRLFYYFWKVSSIMYDPGAKFSKYDITGRLRFLEETAFDTKLAPSVRERLALQPFQRNDPLGEIYTNLLQGTTSDLRITRQNIESIIEHWKAHPDEYRRSASAIRDVAGIAIKTFSVLFAEELVILSAARRRADAVLDRLQPVAEGDSEYTYVN